MKRLILTGWAALAISLCAQETDLRPVVEVEDDVYTYEPANNGAGPMWCQGSTSLLRIGDGVFASGLETLKGAKPLNNCRWLLFMRGKTGWENIATDANGRTREPSPLAGFPDGRVFLSANPTLTAVDTYSGPARPEILEFSAKAPRAPHKTILPKWEGAPKFTEHSYRSFAADGANRELILFQNIDYTHCEWAFLDRQGEWRQGKLKWPWGAEYEKPQPIRVCYPNVALRDRAAHFCGVSDIIEPNGQWRAFKKQLTGREWDYDFRRLFYAWTPDITTGKFRDWIEIASRERTCGWISPGDLWAAPDGTVHILWTERALDERLRAKFFPEAKQSHSLNYAVLREGKVVSQRTLIKAEEGGAGEVPGRARFQIAPGNRLFILGYVSGSDTGGKPISENRVMELRLDGKPTAWVRVPFRKPFSDFFTASVRAGSEPSLVVDILGVHPGAGETISYGRMALGPGKE